MTRRLSQKGQADNRVRRKRSGFIQKLFKVRKFHCGGRHGRFVYAFGFSARMYVYIVKGRQRSLHFGRLSRRFAQEVGIFRIGTQGAESAACHA